MGEYRIKKHVNIIKLSYYPNQRTTHNVVDIFKSIGSACDRPTPAQHMSCRKHHISFRMCKRIHSSRCRVVHKSFVFHKTRLVLELNAHRLRCLFTEWTRQQLTIDPNYNRKIIINNEVHFWMNGKVNKQNCGVWNATNLHDIQERSMQTNKKNHCMLPI